MKPISLFLAFVVLGFVSCASSQLQVPEDMPPSKIIQKAQEATDVNKYQLAVQYYQVLLERYGDNIEYFLTAEYEIAFIRYKQKKYNEARKGFEGLLVLYNGEGGERLPPQFKVLAEKVLAHINQKGY